MLWTLMLWTIMPLTGVDFTKRLSILHSWNHNLDHIYNGMKIEKYMLWLWNSNNLKILSLFIVHYIEWISLDNIGYSIFVSISDYSRLFFFFIPESRHHQAKREQSSTNLNPIKYILFSLKKRTSPAPIGFQDHVHSFLGLLISVDVAA